MPTPEATPIRNVASNVAWSATGRIPTERQHAGLSGFRRDFHSGRLVARHGKRSQPRIDGQLQMVVPAGRRVEPELGRDEHRAWLDFQPQELFGFDGGNGLAGLLVFTPADGQSVGRSEISHQARQSYFQRPAAARRRRFDRGQTGGNASSSRDAATRGMATSMPAASPELRVIGRSGTASGVCPLQGPRVSRPRRPASTAAGSLGHRAARRRATIRPLRGPAGFLSRDAVQDPQIILRPQRADRPPAGGGIGGQLAPIGRRGNQPGRRLLGKRREAIQLLI